MAERKRTAGPWSQYEQNGLIIVDKDGASLGDMTPGNPYISNEEALGNALLVVAAPDLLDACKFAFAAMNSEEGKRRASDVLVAAIAKATT